MEKLEDFLERKGYEWEALLPEFPGLMALDETAQDPEYHGEGSVLEHTKESAGPWFREQSGKI